MTQRNEMGEITYGTDPTLLLKPGDFVQIRRGHVRHKDMYLIIGESQIYDRYFQCLRTDGAMIQVARSVLELVSK